MNKKSYCRYFHNEASILERLVHMYALATPSCLVCEWEHIFCFVRTIHFKEDGSNVFRAAFYIEREFALLVLADEHEEKCLPFYQDEDRERESGRFLRRVHPLHLSHFRCCIGVSFAVLRR